ncbi:hypothetical protein TRVL_09434 [Trypanosoma vivax]|nr:hypothetical protein TRVL_09434 [Trypanosoma vivax]
MSLRETLLSALLVCSPLLCASVSGNGDEYLEGVSDVNRMDFLIFCEVYGQALAALKSAIQYADGFDGETGMDVFDDIVGRPFEEAAGNGKKNLRTAYRTLLLLGEAVKNSAAAMQIFSATRKVERLINKTKNIDDKIAWAASMDDHRGTLFAELAAAKERAVDARDQVVRAVNDALGNRTMCGDKLLSEERVGCSPSRVSDVRAGDCLWMDLAWLCPSKVENECVGSLNDTAEFNELNCSAGAAVNQIVKNWEVLVEFCPVRHDTVTKAAMKSTVAHFAESLPSGEVKKVGLKNNSFLHYNGSYFKKNGLRTDGGTIPWVERLFEAADALETINSAIETGRHAVLQAKRANETAWLAVMDAEAAFDFVTSGADRPTLVRMLAVVVASMSHFLPH